MNDLQVFKFNNSAVRTLELDGEIWFIAKDVADILGYKDTAYAISTHCKGVGEIKMPSNGGLQMTKIISVYDVCLLIQKAKTISKSDKLQFVDVLIGEQLLPIDCFVLESRLEIEFFDIFEKVMKPFGYIMQKQKAVGDYKIDMYIKDICIAIEYDENNHGGYDTLKEAQRESFIKRELGCYFIRVTDSNSHFWNIGYIIKEIQSIKERQK